MLYFRPGEPEIVHAAAGSPRASVLELGAGTGRIADALAALGHPVVAVDESPEMLAHIRNAETVARRSRAWRLASNSIWFCWPRT
jgi:predicted RNA methylase